MYLKTVGKAILPETNLFQVLISEDDNSDLPAPLKPLAEDLCKALPYAKYSLWNNSMIIELLKSEFEEKVYLAYRSLIPYAYRSDLARYCILYHFGGWYFDLGTQLANTRRVVAPIDKSIDMLFFWDLGDLFSPARGFYDCMNGIIFSRPANPILKTAIDLVVDNCKNKFYGSDSMSPTGPGVLGRAIAINGRGKNHYDGQFLQLTPQHSQANRAYILRDGTIFAWHRSHFNDNENNLPSLGVKGGNNYRELWRDHKVYAS